MVAGSDSQKRKVLEREYSRITAKAWHDPAFKARLVADPVAVLKEHGVEAAGRKIRVVENTDDVFHFVLKKRPAHLSTEELDRVVGGQGACTVTECDTCATE
jgi:hypothetical protein